MTTLEFTMKNVAERIEALRNVARRGDPRHRASLEEITLRIETLVRTLETESRDETRLEVKRACDDAAKLAQSATDPLLQVQEFACLSHLTWALAPLLKNV